MENKIASYRNKISITQEELARIVGVTRQTIISLEQNRYNPSLMLAHNISVALNTSIDKLFIFNDSIKIK
jgi:DNA-binding XRE family transcriptional regulator